MKYRTSNLAAVSSIAFCMLISMGKPASADESDKENEEAAAAYAEGKTQFSNNQFIEAAEAFRRANELRPNWRILYNLGQSEAAAKRYGLALEAFERYLVLGGDDISEQRRMDVVREVEQFQKIVGAVEIGAPAGYELYIDGIKRGVCPLPGPVLITASIEHKLEILWQGEAILTRTVLVNGQETKTLRIDESGGDVSTDNSESAGNLENPPAVPPAVQPDSPADDTKSPGQPLKIAGWVTLGTGLATLTAGIVTGIVTLSLRNELDPICRDTGCPLSRESDRDRLDSLPVATDILFIAGGVLATTGGVLLLLHRRKKRESASSVSVLPTFSSGFAGGLFGMEF